MTFTGRFESAPFLDTDTGLTNSPQPMAEPESIIPEWLFKSKVTEPERIEFFYWWKQWSMNTGISDNSDQLRTCTFAHPLISDLKTQIERTPSRRDHQYYFDLYDNPQWKEIPWYSKFFNSIYRCLYFMTGPSFIVPILGIVPETL